MPQVVELGWIPVKEDFEQSSAFTTIKSLQPKVNDTSDLLAQWEGIQSPDGLDGKPVKGVHLAAIWTSVEAANAAKQGPEASEMRKHWGQVIDLSSALPWTTYLSFEGDSFEKVAGASVILLAGSYMPVDTDMVAFYKKWQGLIHSGNVPSGFVAGAHGWSVGNVDYKGEKKKLFMVATGWDSKENCRAATGEDKRAKFKETLKEFNIQEDDHVCQGFIRMK